MLRTAENLRVGDVIVEERRKGKKRKIIRTPVKSIRRGGHTPEERVFVKNGKKVRTVPVDVNPVPSRHLPLSRVIVNEEWVYDRIAKVQVDDVEAIERMASAS